MQYCVLGCICRQSNISCGTDSTRLAWLSSCIWCVALHPCASLHPCACTRTTQVWERNMQAPRQMRQLSTLCRLPSRVFVCYVLIALHDRHMHLPAAGVTAKGGEIPLTLPIRVCLAQLPCAKQHVHHLWSVHPVCIEHHCETLLQECKAKACLQRALEGQATVACKSGVRLSSLQT